MPVRVQMSRQHRWRPDHPAAVIVARPSRWGNPLRWEPGPTMEHDEYGRAVRGRTTPAEARQAALTGAMLLALGDDTLEAVAGRLHTARAAYEVALAEVTGALLVSAGSEVELAQRTGMSRTTVRKALGK